ncbi:MAG TPA: chemotaxis protein CheA [Candidatus Acidoferrales bacterium]|nr:chemotaxis protein CheA [Candidatus Acidoferrales bacterium]
MSVPLDERASDLRELFFETALELLQTLNEDGLALERGAGDVEAIRRVRRVVHTLKGDAAAIGMRELSELAHGFEDVLTPELAAERGHEVAEAVLAAADTFESMLSAARKDLPSPGGETLKVLIHKLCAAPAVEAPPSAAQPGSSRPQARFEWTEYERQLIGEAAARGEAVYQVGVTLEAANLMPSAAWQLVRNVFHSCGSILALHPADDAHAEHVEIVEAAIVTELPQEALRKRLRIPAVTGEVVLERAAIAADAIHDLISLPHGDAQEAAIPPAASSAASPAPRGAAAAAGVGAGANAVPHVAALVDKTLRVDSERIDDVLNLVGELIIGRSMLSRTVAEFDRRFQKDPLATRFADALGFQSRVLEMLQKSVMKIRMVPVEQLFRRFPRIVRDIAKLRGKDVALSVTGESTGLDKSILEPLAEPITHLIRNCVDHGIEPPEERIAAGKPARGTIRLGARHEGNHVVIEVGDDGRGINRQMVVQRAIELGFVTPEEALHLTDMEALGLIFIQGFTMLREVTQISGRGVGMDVVKTALDKLKGTVHVQTTLGKGTTFLLQLPLTLASIKALLAEVGGQLYAIPVASVVEITRVTEAEVHEVDGHEVFQLRNQVLKLVRLDRMNAGGTGKSARASRRLFVIVVALGDRRFGLGVDRLRGEEELVIKALDSRLTQSEFVNGASILGDGTVVMILNLPTVVSKLSRAVMAEVMA